MRKQKHLLPPPISILLIFSVLQFCYAGNYAWKPVDREFDTTAILLDRNLSHKSEENELVLKKLEQISLQKNHPILNIRYRYWNAYLHGDDWGSGGDKNAKNNYLLETLTYFDNEEYDYDYARIQFLMLSDPNNITNYLLQYKRLNEVLEIFQKYGDLVYEGHCYRYMGILFSDLGQHEKALGYLDRADNCYIRGCDSSSLISNLTNRAVVCYYMGYPDSAIGLFQSIVSRSGYIQPKTLISSYINLSLATESDSGKLRYEDSVQVLLERYPDVSGGEYRNAYLVNKAHHNFLLNDISAAMQDYLTALDNAYANNLTNIIPPTLHGLSDCYAAKEDYRQAYLYLTAFQRWQDSLKGLGQISEINTLETTMAIDEYQERLLVQEQKIGLQKRLMWMLGIMVALVVAVLATLLRIYRQSKLLAENTLQIQALKNRQLQQEIDSQNRELSSNMLILSENRKFLRQVMVQMEKMRSKGDMTNPCELSLRKMITNHIQSGDEWEAFKLHFEKVHPEFFSKLKKAHPTLTGNDLKLCAYIRIGLNIKQISQMTAVLPATIKTNRYLLKKKLSLGEDLSLDDYIAGV